MDVRSRGKTVVAVCLMHLNLFSYYLENLMDLETLPLDQYLYNDLWPMMNCVPVEFEDRTVRPPAGGPLDWIVKNA